MFSGYRRGLFRNFASQAMSSTDCYSALGIPVGSGEDLVKNAYRKLVKVHHPDLGGSTDRFLRIQKAYENLMDSGSPNSDSSSSGSASTGARSKPGGDWKSWDTSSTWWSDSSKYSSENDFDADFEEQWRKFTQRSARREVRRKPPTDFEPLLCDMISVSCLRFSSLSGEYERIAKFNGKRAYHNKQGSLFVFWSNKSKDWKFSARLKDDGVSNCAAFTDRVHPSVQSPFSSSQSPKWMVWDEKAKRYVSATVGAKECDYSTWSISDLRAALEKLGEPAQDCFDKSQLVQLLKRNANDDKPEFQLCSRQRHDGVVQTPPVLSASCKVGKNRIDAFSGPLENVETWLLKNGDRRRLYAVYDVENTFCFCLIWKDNKRWVRAGPYDF